MTWKIDTITLPFGGPQTVQRRVLRRQTSNKIIEDFPIPVDIGPQSYELRITGLIHARGNNGSNADQLWETVKAAENPTIQIIITDEPEMADYGGNKLYAVNKADVGMSRARFDASTGEIVREYDITFIEFEEDIGEQDTGELELDEDGIGNGDLNLSFGDFVFDIFQNLFPNILS